MSDYKTTELLEIISKDLSVIKCILISGIAAARGMDAKQLLHDIEDIYNHKKESESND